MQQAVPYRTWLPIKSETQIINRSSIVDNLEDHNPLRKGSGIVMKMNENSKGGIIKRLVLENAVLVFGRRGCCMCHVIKRFLLGLGVNPAVYEVIDEADEICVVNELSTIVHPHNIVNNGGVKPQFPAVYIGGELFGGLDKLMGAHITGQLIPKLKQVGALWL